jgi:hypothetical protein
MSAGTDIAQVNQRNKMPSKHDRSTKAVRILLTPKVGSALAAMLI